MIFLKLNIIFMEVFIMSNKEKNSIKETLTLPEIKALLEVLQTPVEEEDFKQQEKFKEWGISRNIPLDTMSTREYEALFEAWEKEYQHA